MSSITIINKVVIHQTGQTKRAKINVKLTGKFQ